MPDVDLSGIADQLSAVFRDRDYRSAHVTPDGRITLQHYVTVRRPADRFPWATIWVEPAGITWGDNFEHELELGEAEGRAARLADAVLATEAKP